MTQFNTFFIIEPSIRNNKFRWYIDTLSISNKTFSKVLSHNHSVCNCERWDARSSKLWSWITQCSLGTAVETCKLMFLWTRTRTRTREKQNLRTRTRTRIHWLQIRTRSGLGPGPSGSRPGFFLPIYGTICINKLKKDQCFDYLLATLRK